MSRLEQGKSRYGEGACVTCGWSKGLTHPPTLGRLRDGVKCSNPRVAEEQKALEDTVSIREFEERGYVVLWRIEVISDALCPHWKAKP